jgi:hypothetical protein
VALSAVSFEKCITNTRGEPEICKLKPLQSGAKISQTSLGSFFEDGYGSSNPQVTVQGLAPSLTTVYLQSIKPVSKAS